MRLKISAFIKRYKCRSWLESIHHNRIFFSYALMKFEFLEMVAIKIDL